MERLARGHKISCLQFGSYIIHQLIVSLGCPPHHFFLSAFYIPLQKGRGTATKSKAGSGFCRAALGCLNSQLPGQLPEEQIHPNLFDILFSIMILLLKMFDSIKFCPSQDKSFLRIQLSSLEIKTGSLTSQGAWKMLDEISRAFYKGD